MGIAVPGSTYIRMAASEHDKNIRILQECFMVIHVLHDMAS